MGSDIVVVGSLNMDMTVKVARRPNRGETVFGNNFFMSPGGKGANQAYAARRLGASVSMIGRVGADVFGEQLRSNLQRIGVDMSSVEALPGQSSGIALISVDPEGDNSIIVALGANESITTADVRRYEALIRQAKLLMVQLEIPLESVMEAVEIAHLHKVPVLLDPAPARPLPDELLKMVDYIVPNESEIAELTGIKVFDEPSAIRAAAVLMGKGVKNVFSKLGGKGVVVVKPDQTFHVEGYSVEAVDTTAAGDSFAGAVGAALVAGKDVIEAARFANAVGAIAVTRAGAQASMPELAEVESFMKQPK
ncbi:ribokinase [Cohnella pontilimi]|uniref:Ribokinase n=1 Tax=Cohnella pontilimi TaxID=2564100 RepID=A0A4U0FES9_9BACL|nr:ribokinase [Cohnella pontilimi]TJY43331.1 ribokinase [Cohnella pontilimi]